MKSFQSMTVAEQLAFFLRTEIEEGRLLGMVPGVLSLEAQMGVNRKTIDAALRQLEAQGYIASQGAGKRRQIVSRRPRPSHMFRIAILDYGRLNQSMGYMVELRHRLSEAGFHVILTPKTLTELGMDLEKISQVVHSIAADAWIVVSAPSDVIEWFAAQALPLFGMYGATPKAKIARAGPDHCLAMLKSVRRLISLGHHRIVLLMRSSHRKPKIGRLAKGFLAELGAQGIETSAYHFPEWEETPDGLHQCLESLFKLTPPTAMVIDESSLFLAVYQFCCSKGLRVPRDVSLICIDDDKRFRWFVPEVSRFQWDREKIIRRVEQWAANVRNKKEDLQNTRLKSEFYEGGTIGPVSLT